MPLKSAGNSKTIVDDRITKNVSVKNGERQMVGIFVSEVDVELFLFNVFI